MSVVVIPSIESDGGVSLGLRKWKVRGLGGAPSDRIRACDYRKVSSQKQGVGCDGNTASEIWPLGILQDFNLSLSEETPPTFRSQSRACVLWKTTRDIKEWPNDTKEMRVSSAGLGNGWAVVTQSRLLGPRTQVLSPVTSCIQLKAREDCSLAAVLRKLLMKTDLRTAFILFVIWQFLAGGRSNRKSHVSAV